MSLSPHKLDGVFVPYFGFLGSAHDGELDVTEYRQAGLAELHRLNRGKRNRLLTRKSVGEKADHTFAGDDKAILEDLDFPVMAHELQSHPPAGRVLAHRPGPASQGARRGYPAVSLVACQNWHDRTGRAGEIAATKRLIFCPHTCPHRPSGSAFYGHF